MKEIEITKLPGEIIKDLKKETRDVNCDYILESEGKLFRICHLNPKGPFNYRVIYFSFSKRNNCNYLKYFATSTPLFFKDYIYLLLLFIPWFIITIKENNTTEGIIYNLLLFPLFLLIIVLLIFIYSFLVNIFSKNNDTIKIGNLLSRNIKSNLG